MKVVRFVVNPGTEIVGDATEVDATTNMVHFLRDLLAADERHRGVRFVQIGDGERGDGRFAYLVWNGNNCAEVRMPGLSLDRVRFIHGKDQNPWNYPRLYVDGSSWLWSFAVDMVSRILSYERVL